MVTGNPVRNAILWNDTRTTAECREIERTLGDELLTITRNPALEGFTLPKILWVREHEPEAFARASLFVLPKDYVRYRLTGDCIWITPMLPARLLLDVAAKHGARTFWKPLACQQRSVRRLSNRTDLVGTILPEAAASGRAQYEQRRCLLAERIMLAARSAREF